jgi:hypothetical protein
MFVSAEIRWCYPDECPTNLHRWFGDLHRWFGEMSPLLTGGNCGSTNIFPRQTNLRFLSKNAGTSTYQTRPLAEPQLIQLADDAAHCQRCLLYRNATQTIFGEGPLDAALLLGTAVRTGRPGGSSLRWAGRILDLALEKTGLDRRSIYVTNAVKHFKHEQRGKRRIHKRPNRDHQSTLGALF